LNKRRTEVLAGLLLSFASSAAAAATPWLIKYILDLFRQAGQAALLLKWAPAVAGFLLLSSVLEMAGEYFVVRLATGIVADLRRDLFAKLTALALADLRKIRSGEAVSRILSDVERLQSLAQRTLGAAIVSLLSLGALLVTLALLSWRLTSLAILLVPLYSLCILPLSRQAKQLVQKRQSLLVKLSCFAQEVVAGAEIIKGHCAEWFQIQRFSEVNREHRDNSLRVACLTEAGRTFAEVLAILGGLGIIFLANREFSLGRLSPQTLIAYLAGCGLLLTTTGKVGKAHVQLKEFWITVHRVQEIFRLPDEDPGWLELPVQFKGEMKFEKVSFSYSGDVITLHDISLHIAPGEVFAIVGPSGAGKTTLANLIPRFYRPSSGRILLDGHDVTHLRLEQLRRCIAIVPQDPFLFDGTLWDNVRLGNWQATRTQIIEAARLACVDQFISELPEGYDSQVGERGLALSGGQRQRVAIARALLRGPRILILDEATSMVDGETESKIYQSIREFMARGTCVWITHRLATVRMASRVAFMRSGAITNIGSPDALLESCPAFAQFWSDQLHESEAEAEQKRRAVF
jgi:ABC-type multidrug transport system fused ATPase/permease subunit